MKLGKICVWNYVVILLGVFVLGKEMCVMFFLNDDKSNFWIIVFLDVFIYL